MKKVVLLILIGIFLIGSVFAFDTSRAISGNDVAITIDISDTTGYIVDEILPSGVTPSDIGQGGTYTASVRTIRWTKSDNSATSLTYSYSGSGTVSGTIIGGNPASQKITTGDTILGSSSSPIIKINEFESNPAGTDDGTEWIELYNPNSFEVDVGEWKVYDELVTSNLIYTIPASTIISSGDYYIIELSLNWLNDENEFITLKDSLDVEIDQTPTKADINDDSNSWQRIPDGLDNWEFRTQTKGTTNNYLPGVEDDLIPNYVRGQILIDGSPASEGNIYTIEVLTGANAGESYTGAVDDSLIPTSLKGNGYFDTGDQTEFSTGDSFRVSFNGYSQEGVFADGGNGDFVSEEGLIILECMGGNNPPIIDPIADILIEEDSGFTNNFVLSATDSDGTIDRFEVYEENIEEVDCIISDSMFGVTPAHNFEGTATCTIRVYDNDENYDETTVNIIVSNVNDAPVILTHSPIGNPNIPNTGSQEFEISWEDIDSSSSDVHVEWLVEGVQENIGESYTFVGEGISKNYNIKVIVSDLEFSVNKTWTLTTTDVLTIGDRNYCDFIGGCDAGEGGCKNDSECNAGTFCFADIGGWYPIYNDLAHSGLIADAWALDVCETEEVYISRPIPEGNRLHCNVNNLCGEGKGDCNADNGCELGLYCLERDDVDVVDEWSDDYEWWVDFCVVNPNDPGAPEDNAPYHFADLNDNWKISQDELDYAQDLFDTRYIDSLELARITSFFNAGGYHTCEEGVGGFCSGESPPTFGDADNQCSLQDSRIKISIKEPDKGDDFEVGDIIEIEVKIENDFDEDMDFDVEVELYDLDEDESIEDVGDDVDIDEGDSETLNFEIEIPDDIDAGNDFAIYVYVEGEDDECASKYILIDIEREDDALVIDRFEIIPPEIRAGRIVNFEIKVSNVGEDDQDAEIRISNSELGLNIEDEFEIEEYDDRDDYVVKSYSFKVPQDIEPGSYQVEVEINYNGETIEETYTLIVESYGNVYPSGLLFGTRPQGVLLMSYPVNSGSTSASLIRQGTALAVEDTVTFVDRDSTTKKTKSFVTGSSVISDVLASPYLWVLNAVLFIGSIIIIWRIFVWISMR
ncbi:MAG: lamin tail domain-containing protein [Nanoarchaeota archaeon]|nr:lamin tail domain-containing protein [Nanoarchaeota archaeon]